MAPITRSSVHGRQSQLDNRRTVEESHMRDQDQEMADQDEETSVHEGATNHNNFLLTQQDVPDSTTPEMQPGSNMLIDTLDAQSPFRSSAQEMLRPLQDTADRVSRQVEEFAKALDRFVSTREPTDESLWEDALVLLERYSKIADIQKSRTTTEESAGEREKTQLESDLWILVRNLLYCNSPPSLNDAQIARESRLGGLHRYSSNVEIWTAFLDSDAAAQEYETILAWLQERAAETSPPIEDCTRSLAEKSERGDGIWSAGPIFTQAAIKQQKRTRVWSLPLEPSNPGLNRTHVRKGDQKPLVAQLDPDAPTRESAVLQEQDEFHEQAAWQTYWEMLRRGYNNGQIQSWFAERKEVWRYTTLGSCGPHAEQMGNSPWLRILNFASNSEWLKRCEILAHNPAIQDHFQKAVYGILCGDDVASKSATRNIDDNLFSIFNSLLIRRYQHYLQAYRKRLTDTTTTEYRPQPPSTTEVQQYVALAQTNPTTKDESQQPHKLMELAIVSKDFDNFFVNMGRAAARIAHATGQGSHLMTRSENESSEVAKLNAQDQDCVRMIAHLQLLLRSLGLLRSSYDEHEYELENNIAAYIGLLEHWGKWLLIPLYASKLSKKRSYHVLGAILINVTDRRERDLQVKLMKQYKINVSEVTYGIFSLANYSDLQKLRRYKHGPIPARITVLGGSGKLAQYKIQPSLMTGEVAEADEKAVRSVEWIRYVDAENWGAAAWSVAVLYKVFLIEGKFIAMRQLLDRVRLSEMSLAAVGMNLHFADADPPINTVENEAEMDEDRVTPMSSPTRRRKAANSDHPLLRAGTDRQTLALKSLIWKQLEQLVAAIDALDIFQEVADGLEQHRTNPSVARNYKRDLKRALEQVRQDMLPLFDNDFLCQPQDDMEAVVLNDIRNHYIPECILAYNSALWFAGHFSSRAWLVECMTLAQVIAETPMLTNAFVESGRMKELVRAFAVDSQALLQATEQGASGGAGASAGRAKKIKTDKGNADIWKVSWKEETGPLDLDAMD
ncbi:uncharacterized protein Z519_08161 [Cladophialophora bantiana CBS 173.52]|uniref:Nuclear pore complex protein n=1 Tax=Cladophialophora bantiana (strain ATCC 10958 / CBS 173.52 / CDC B-1940 / NIH 8579) TaxID=1442370 RepID=A0A0D2HKG4_CLAB1|nr:uncharacterized protein Z519_08161 [Cladophialophora bantiana CBS 173.52]KIW91265.1 hypothetical protein Z519_08161 [Cladophialophora bantiana CBS 173.52]